MKGVLYIVSTPIGNLEDITLRALNTLRAADVIAAEDTRHSRKLLSHYGIAKPLVSYWGERERSKAEEVLQRLKNGESVALVSDAGTPGISDPGGVLVSRAIEEDVAVVPVPGPTALIAALSVSGLPTDTFVFVGFLPPRQVRRRKVIDGLKSEQRTLVFYEAPHRIVEVVEDLAAGLGGRKAVVIREITKMHEEIIRGDLDELAGRLRSSKALGEYVIVVEGRSDAATLSAEEGASEVAALMKGGMGRKEAVRKVAAEHGLSRTELYNLSISGRRET